MAGVDRITAIWRECLLADGEHILTLPPMREWTDAAKAEPDGLEELDAEI